MDVGHTGAGETMEAERASGHADSPHAAGATDDEPRLKYQRLGSSCVEILQNDAASCMVVEDKMLALGTQHGVVFVIDYHGNEIRRFESHTATINDLSFDEKSEFIASCSDDGNVVVHSLYTDEVTRLKYSRPVKTVALDPKYGSRKDRQIASGGLAGQLMLNSRGWLGPKDVVLHKGEGAISKLRWAGHLIAWANDKGVKVYDTQVHQRIGHIEYLRLDVSEEAHNCSLHWESDALLYIGRGSSVQIARIKEQEHSHSEERENNKGLTSSLGSLPQNLGLQVQYHIAGPHRYVEIVASFQTDYVVAGICPFGLHLAILAYLPIEGDNLIHGNTQISAGQHQAAVSLHEARRPELRIVTWDNQDIVSDALSLHGFEHYTANDYCLAAFHPMQCRAHGHSGAPSEQEGAMAGDQGVRKWWWDGYEPFYFVVSPKDIVQGRPRDTEDRIAWMLSHGRFEDALALIERGECVERSTRDSVGQAYLEHLMQASKFAEAAALCPRLLQGNAAAWERWVYMFAQVRQLPLLAPYIPVEDPRLRNTAYEVVLSSLLANASDHQEMLRLIRLWPTSGIYSAEHICEKAQARLKKYGGSTVLNEVVAELYKIQGNMDAVLDILLSLSRKDVFQFVLENNLLSSLSAKLESFMAIDEERTLALLVEYTEDVSSHDVVQALQAAGAKSQKSTTKDYWRRQLHRYLHMLFLREPDAGAQHHNLQVQLYADYDPKAMMYFLTHSERYALEEAYDICKASGLVKEMVFILGRMGNAPRALCLIIDELEDIPQAVEFVHDQRDDELWDVLISHASSSPHLTAALLQEIGSYCNPLRLLQQIPCGMCIPGLRDHLVKILCDFRTQTSLREGCSSILRMDCVLLGQKLYNHVRRAQLPLYCLQEPAGAADSQGVLQASEKHWLLLQQSTPSLAACAAPADSVHWLGTPSTESTEVVFVRKLTANPKDHSAFTGDSSEVTERARSPASGISLRRLVE